MYSNALQIIYLFIYLLAVHNSASQRGENKTCLDKKAGGAI